MRAVVCDKPFIITRDQFGAYLREREIIFVAVNIQCLSLLQLKTIFNAYRALIEENKGDPMFNSSSVDDILKARSEYSDTVGCNISNEAVIVATF